MKKKVLVRVWIVMAIMLIVSFSDWSFAAEEPNGLKNIAYILNFLVQTLSRIWVIFAKIAWEFLTNKRVYGEILWLDALLWRYRVVVRNLANIWLWLFFVYTILMALFKKNDITKKIKDTLLRLFIAWLWIQTSRFLVSVVMDMSTITLVAAWSVPAQVISQSADLEKSFIGPFTGYMNDNMVVSWSEILLFSNEWLANNLLGEVHVKIKNEDQITTEQFLDDLLPKYDDMSWPLYYMWIAILKSFSAGEIPTKDTGENWRKETIINVIINGWATIVYSLEMLVLCVLAIIRIFYLWMFIVLSPFVVLIYCIKKADPEGWWKLIDKTLDSFTKSLNIKSFLINAFKPAIIVLWIWITVIFVAKMKWILVTDEPIKYQGVTVTSRCQQEKECNTYIDSPILAGSFKNLSKTFMDIILALITVILVYEIIKFSVGIGDSNDFISKKVGELQEGIWDFVTKTPIVPVSWYDEKWLPSINYVSAWTAFGLWNTPSIMERAIEQKKTEFKRKTNDQLGELMNKRWFGNSNVLTETQKSSIVNAWRYNKWLEALEAKRKEIKWVGWWKWLSLGTNPGDGWFWKESFGSWLTSLNGKLDIFGWVSNPTYREAWENMVEKWDSLKDKTLDEKYAEIFRIPNAARAYADFFGLWVINTWDELKNKDISGSWSEWKPDWDSEWTWNESEWSEQSESTQQTPPAQSSATQTSTTQTPATGSPSYS